MGWYPQASIEPTDRILVLWACSSIDVWLKPIAPIAVRERNWVRTRGLVSCRAGDVIRSPFFSGAMRSIQICWVSVKGCYTQTV
jgi:hypothetical protein